MENARLSTSGTGNSPRPEGHAGPQANEWAPFDGFEDRDAKGARFVKELYHWGKLPDNPLHGYGDLEIRKIAKWLDAKHARGELPKGSVAHWRYVQTKLQNLQVNVKTKISVHPDQPIKSGEIAAKKPGPAPVVDTQRGSVRKPGGYQGVLSGEIVKGEINKPKADPPKPAEGGTPPNSPPRSFDAGPARGGVEPRLRRHQALRRRGWRAQARQALPKQQARAGSAVISQERSSAARTASQGRSNSPGACRDTSQHGEN